MSPENRETNRASTAENRDHITPPPKQPSPCEPEWGEVEVRLKAIGIQADAHLCGVAKSRGYTPALVLGIVEHFESNPGAWDSVGVVYNAINNHSPDVPADAESRWPKKSAVGLARDRTEHLVAQTQAEARRRIDQMKKVQADRITEADRDAKYGSIVDAMPFDELQQRCSKNSLMARRLEKMKESAGPLPPVIRNFIIRQLDTEPLSAIKPETPASSDCVAVSVAVPAELPVDAVPRQKSRLDTDGHQGGFRKLTSIDRLAESMQPNMKLGKRSMLARPMSWGSGQRIDSS